MTHRASPDPDVSDEEWELFRENERREDEVEPKPAPVKTCGGCENYEKCGSMTGLCRIPGGDGSPVFADDEACKAREGSE